MEQIISSRQPLLVRVLETPMWNAPPSPLSLSPALEPVPPVQADSAKRPMRPATSVRLRLNRFIPVVTPLLRCAGSPYGCRSPSLEETLRPDGRFVSLTSSPVDRTGDAPGMLSIGLVKQLPGS